MGVTLGQRAMGIQGVVDYDGNPLTTKRIFLKTIFVMFLDSGLFYIISYFVLSKKENKLVQAYSDRLVRSVHCCR